MMMAIFRRGRDCFVYRLKSLTTSQRFNHSLAEEGLGLVSDHVAKPSLVVDMSKWKQLNSKLFGITHSMITPSSWTVLKILQKEGFEAYLVGGCVRDLLLRRTPKDFDVITTANLKQINKQFRRSVIVGRRFPICRVRIKGSVVEVSSFDTVAEHSEDKEKVLLSHLPSGCDEKDFLRWRNSMHRDFTINSLFFDPFKNRIYDYANGLADLRSLKLRTLIPAQLSFLEDCARILRGLRIAGRLGLSISKDTETAMRKFSSSIKSLGKDRTMMELNYMLSYGAAASTIHLLQKFNLLEMFLPFHAAYLDQQDGQNFAPSSSMLMKLLSNLDNSVACDRPCHCTLWVGLLAFHQALVLNPQDAFVIWAFASIMYHGNWKKGVKFTKEKAKMQVKFVPELSGTSEFKSNEELAKEVTQLASIVQATVGAFVDEDCLLKTMSRYPVTSCSSLVFVPNKIGCDVAQLFDVMRNDIQSYSEGRESLMIDHHLLGKGDPCENRFVLGKVILETLTDGLVAGVEVKPEVTDEKCDQTLSDLVKHQVVVKEDKNRILLPFDSEPKQEMAKKQKLAKDKCFSEQELCRKKDKVVSIAEENQKAIKTSQSPAEELNIMLMSLLEEKTCHSPHREKSDEEHAIGGECQRTGKQMDTEEKMKHHMLHDEENLQLLDLFKKSNLRRDDKAKWEGMKLEEKSEEVRTKEQSGPLPRLSSLFKR